MTRLPIRLRVTFAFAVAMAAVLAGTGWLLYARLDSDLAASLDRDLRLRAQDLAAVVDQPGATFSRTGSGRLVEKGESYAQLLDQYGNVLQSTHPLGRQRLLTHVELIRAARAPLFAGRRSVPGLDEPSRLLATPVALPSGRGVLVVGATQQNNVETLSGFSDELVIVGPVALALASLAGYLLAGLALRPVESMRRRAAAITADTAGERLPVPPTGDEVERLGETLNAMLARLEAALARERNFVADAGHELRTPLALLRTELELALRHAESADELREAVRWSSEEAERLSRLADDLLLIARSDQGNLPLQLETLEVSELLQTVVTRYAWRAEEERRRLVVEAPEHLGLQGDRLRLEQALANLVDNALRHGAGDVTLSATATDGVVQLHVRDRGTGFPTTFLARAFERFARADQSRARGGAGLGLPIVRAIAEAHGGTAQAGNAPTGGADVWITLKPRFTTP
jgi:heavy metal sensor kinase